MAGRWPLLHPPPPSDYRPPVIVAAVQQSKIFHRCRRDTILVAKPAKMCQSPPCAHLQQPPLARRQIGIH